MANARDLLLTSLRRPELDTQSRTREALVIIENLLIQKDNKLALMLISEFIFCEKNKLGRLSISQELQLVVVLCEYFSKPDDANKNIVFFNLFDAKLPSRKFVLLKLIVTSIVASITPALSLAGIWIQEPQTRDYRIELARSLVEEILFFSDNSLNQFKLLPTSAVLFSNSFLQLISEIFIDQQFPPPIIQDIFTEWITKYPTLLFAYGPQVSETGSIALAGLIRWCSLAPLFENQPNYSKLHLSLLQSLSNQEAIQVKPVIFTKQLEVVVDVFLKVSKTTKDQEDVQKSLERFAQIIAISRQYLYGNVPQFVERLKKLPSNLLLDIVITSIQNNS
ncbi:unnamed protein product [Diamesa hyperborea]